MEEYTDKYGVVYGDEGETLVRCPLDITGQYIIPEGIISIGSNAFANCVHLEAVIIPRSVVRIGGFAFNRCKNLKSIVILSNRLSAIGISCFRYCENLTIVATPGVARKISRSINSDSGVEPINSPINVTIEEYDFEKCPHLDSDFIKRYLPDIHVSAEDNNSADDTEDVYYEPEETPIDTFMDHFDDLDPVQQALLRKESPQKSDESKDGPKIQSRGKKRAKGIITDEHLNLF